MRLAFPLAAVALLAATPSAAATLGDVRAAIAAITTMSAEFTQTAADGSVLRGHMDLKQPGRIRFDYGGKVPYLIVSDGKTLSFVDYKVAQVSQWPLRSTPLGVLLDPDADLARVARVLPDSESPVPAAVAVAARDPKRPEMGAILILMQRNAAAPGGLMLMGWRVVDAQGNFTAVELEKVRYNEPIDERRFRFSDPRGPRFPGRG
jgi:outer membrane lipoprotein-sorting protein